MGMCVAGVLVVSGTVGMSAGGALASGASWPAGAGLGAMVGAGLAQPEGRPARGLADLPATAAGARVRAWFEAINANDHAAGERFNQEHRAPAALARTTAERRAQQYGQVASMTGGLDVARVFEEAGALVVFVRDRAHGEMLEIRFELAAETDSLIDGIFIRPGGSPDLYGVEWTEFADLRDLLGQVRRDTGIPAIAAAVVRDGRIIDSATVGVRRFGGEDAVGPDARFHWGSVTKGLTATAIATLVERGVLSWDTTIAEAFPEAAVREEYRGVTLRQLLSHTAGVAQYTMIDGATGRRMSALPGSPMDKRHAFMLDVLGQEPLFAPGAGFRYSNAGYGLAAHMAETVSGIAWEDLVREAVFRPLGMATAGLGLPSSLSEDEPVGHVGAGPEFRATLGGVPDLPPIWPAGNVHSDIEDLARYAAMHLAGLRGADGLLRAETIAALHDPAPGTGTSGFDGYALGWAIERWPTGDVVTHAHNGSAGTYYATVRLIPAEGLAIVTLMSAGQPGDDLAPRIERAIYDHFVGR